ncbi:hypothetical protein GC207_00125 [bacterium]|nr:hypothetical protein [bacterium]
MNSPKMWLRQKLAAPCACPSGRSYRSCCLRREIALFMIGVVAAAILFAAHDRGWAFVVTVISGAAVLGWVVGRRFRRPRNDGP